MKRFLKSFRYGQKGFTLMELLIVIAILGVLAVVLVPRLSAFLTTGHIAAANTEVANCETAALAYYADNNGTWPTDAAALFTGDYISAQPKYFNYPFGADSDGKTTLAGGTASATGESIKWDSDTHKWIKS